MAAVRAETGTARHLAERWRVRSDLAACCRLRARMLDRLEPSFRE